MSKKQKITDPKNSQKHRLLRSLLKSGESRVCQAFLDFSFQACLMSRHPISGHDATLCSAAAPSTLLRNKILWQISRCHFYFLLLISFTVGIHSCFFISIVLESNFSYLKLETDQENYFESIRAPKFFLVCDFFAFYTFLIRMLKNAYEYITVYYVNSPVFYT